MALYNLRPVRLPGHEPSSTSQQSFCNQCGKAPNTEVSAAAQSCVASDMTFLAALSPRAVQTLTSSSDPMDGPDAYSDCKVEMDGISVPLIHGKNVSGVDSYFNIRWTDLKSVNSANCCAALSPLLRSLYVGGGSSSPSEMQAFCDACKTAYNPGVGLAAFRSCATGASVQEGSN